MEIQVAHRLGNGLQLVGGVSPAVWGVYVGTSAPPSLKTYAQWLASKTGYWAWIDISQEVTGNVAVTIASGDIAVGGTPLTAGFTRYATAQLSSGDMTFDGMPLTASATEEGQVSAALSSSDINLMASALTAAYIRYAAGSLSAGNNDLSGAALTSAFIRFITATLSAGDVAVAGTALTATASGGATAVSDDFNRADSGTLGVNWTQLPGTGGRFSISSNVAQAAAGTIRGDYWSANTFADNQYSEASTNGQIAVRMSSSAHTCYYIKGDMVDEGDGYMTVFYELHKVVAGTDTQIGTSWGFDSGGNGTAWTTGTNIIRIEASGTTISLKTATSHGGALTTRITASDSAISSGSAGLYSTLGGGPDNWYGGDL